MKPEECAPISKRLIPSAEQVEHLMKSRRSIRVYKEKPVPRETLDKLIDIAHYAPTGGNIQPVRWLVIEDREEVKRLGGLVMDGMRSMIKETPGLDDVSYLGLIVSAWDLGIDVIMRGAPHLVVVHARTYMGLSQVDCIIALTYLELAAYSMGLGVCWNGLFQMAATAYPPLTQALQLPEGHQCQGAMMIGYPKYRYRRIPLRKEPKVVWR
jgi:nitroreductase